MIDQQFLEIQTVEDTHFWYKARREIIEKVLSKFDLLDKRFSVLEIGAANGTNIAYFKKYFNTIKGCEINKQALEIAQNKNPEIIFYNGWLPYNIGFDTEKFDLIFLFDVLEHIEDDKSALYEIHKKLKVNGNLIVTVPAYQFLFGAFDRFSHHFRRYNQFNLTNIVTAAHFRVKYCSYFNLFLFPIVLISRLIEKYVRKTVKYGITQQNNSVLNKVFYKIMSSEKNIITKVKFLPYGSSLILIAQKNFEN